jgi:SAM-dependent methyltransferase
MPWDAGKVPLSLKQYLPKIPRGARILVPGCGSGYEARYLAESAFDVLAIDFSPAALELAQKNLGRFTRIAQLADFFEFDYGAPFDVLYERAFLCSLPKKTWQRYAERSAEILKSGGVIAGFFFFAEGDRGPPFGTGLAELCSLLEPAFELIDDQPVTDSIEIFAGKERWQVWRRC